MRWMFLVFLFVVSVALADGPDREYIQIYNLIEQADNLSKAGNHDLATERYRTALAGLTKLQSIYPLWNENVVKYRIAYLTEKLRATAVQTNTAPVQAESAVPTTKSNPFLEELQRLQVENAKLAEQLKQSPQSSAAGEDELSRLRNQISELQKERDSLKVALDQQPPAKTTSKTTAPNNRDQELERLRARLESLEARPAPFTAEELALFRRSAAQLAPMETKPVKKSRELPAGSGTLVAQAERAFAARQFDEAEKKYLEVLRQDENNVYILGNLAATQLEMNQMDDAEKNIAAALAIDPEDAFSLTLLGIIKFRQNNFDEALDLLSRSARINPQNPETQNYLGITLSQKGQRASAEAALRKAVQLQPNYAGAHHNLAVIYATQRPPFLELARWHYERAVSLGHPKNSGLEKILSDAK